MDEQLLAVIGHPTAAPRAAAYGSGCDIDDIDMASVGDDDRSVFRLLIRRRLVLRAVTRRARADRPGYLTFHGPRPET